jgi:two-component system, sensor histidine kinase
MISKPSTTRVRRVRILLVDGDVEAVETLAALLRAEGHIVGVAYDGDAGLECFDTFIPDLAIVELRLPKLDGFLLVRSVRTKVRFETTPIVALTTCDSPADRERTKKLGFARHFAKPADLKQLERIIAEVQASLVRS